MLVGLLACGTLCPSQYLSTEHVSRCQELAISAEKTNLPAAAVNCVEFCPHALELSILLSCRHVALNPPLDAFLLFLSNALGLGSIQSAVPERAPAAALPSLN